MRQLQILSLLSGATVLLASNAPASDFSSATIDPSQLVVTARSIDTESPVQLVVARRRHRSGSGYTLQRRRYSSESARYQSYPRQYNDFRPYNRLITPSNLYRPYAHAPYYDYFYGP